MTEGANQLLQAFLDHAFAAGMDDMDPGQARVLRNSFYAGVLAAMELVRAELRHDTARDRELFARHMARREQARAGMVGSL